jgi:hypothetical protein
LIINESTKQTTGFIVNFLLANGEFIISIGPSVAQNNIKMIVTHIILLGGNLLLVSWPVFESHDHGIFIRVIKNIFNVKMLDTISTVRPKSFSIS